MNGISCLLLDNNNDFLYLGLQSFNIGVYSIELKAIQKELIGHTGIITKIL